MTGNQRRISFMFLIGMLLAALPAVTGADLLLEHTAPGGWMIMLDGSSLIAGEGSDLVASSTSSDTCDLLSVLCDSPETLWSINAALQSMQSSFVLEMRVSDPGTGSGGYTSDDEFITLSTEYSTVMTGNGSRDGIAVQYRVSGISISAFDHAQHDMGIIYSLIY